MFIKLRRADARVKKQTKNKRQPVPGYSAGGLALDPGNVNVGFCVWAANPDKDLWRIVKVGLGFENPIRGLKRGSDVLTAFAILHHFFNEEILSVRKVLRPKGLALCAGERFLARGRFGGTLAEVANFQLAALTATALFQDAPLGIFGAAEWKNAFGQLSKKDAGIPPLKSWYLSTKSVHNIDALFIGLYNANLLSRALTSNSFREVFNATFLPVKSRKAALPAYARAA